MAPSRISPLPALALACLLLAPAGGAAPGCNTDWRLGMGMGTGQGGPPAGLGPLSGDQRFIVMMIPHHQGAIAMAALAVVRGGQPEVRALAKRIATSQRQENAQMRRWYSQRPELRALEQAMVRVQSEEIRLMEQWLREWFKQKPPA